MLTTADEAIQLKYKYGLATCPRGNDVVYYLWLCCESLSSVEMSICVQPLFQK